MDFPDKPRALSAKPLPKDFLSFFESGLGEDEEGEAPLGAQGGLVGAALGISHLLLLWVPAWRPWLIWGSVCSTCGCIFIP